MVGRGRGHEGQEEQPREGQAHALPQRPPVGQLRGPRGRAPGVQLLRDRLRTQAPLQERLGGRPHRPHEPGAGGEEPGVPPRGGRGGFIPGGRGVLPLRDAQAGEGDPRGPAGLRGAGARARGPLDGRVAGLQAGGVQVPGRGAQRLGGAGRGGPAARGRRGRRAGGPALVRRRRPAGARAQGDGGPGPGGRGARGLRAPGVGGGRYGDAHERADLPVPAARQRGLRQARPDVRGPPAGRRRGDRRQLHGGGGPGGRGPGDLRGRAPQAPQRAGVRFLGDGAVQAPGEERRGVPGTPQAGGVGAGRRRPLGVRGGGRPGRQEAAQGGVLQRPGARGAVGEARARVPPPGDGRGQRVRRRRRRPGPLGAALPARGAPGPHPPQAEHVRVRLPGLTQRGLRPHLRLLGRRELRLQDAQVRVQGRAPQRRVAGRQGREVLLPAAGGRVAGRRRGPPRHAGHRGGAPRCEHGRVRRGPRRGVRERLGAVRGLVRAAVLRLGEDS